MSINGLSPSAGVFLPVTSDDLKTFKKQVLKQAYDSQIQKWQRPLIVNPQKYQSTRHGDRIRQSRSIGVLPLYNNQPYDRQFVKKQLQNSYNAEINRKSLQKVEQSKRKLMQQNDMLGELQKHQSRQYLRHAKAKQQYRQFLQQQITRKNQQKRYKRKEQIQIETNKINRRLSLNNKERSFKEYYSNVDKFRDNCGHEYISYHKNSNDDALNKLKFERNEVQKQNVLVKKQIQEETRNKFQKKAQLKTALQKQIFQNRSFKADQLRQFKNRGYVKSQVNLYNPISNPIDYKIDINNKYLLKEIMRKNPIEQMQNNTQI